MKRLVVLMLVLSVVAGLSIPLVNLAFPPDTSMALPTRSEAMPQWSKVVTIFTQKCVHCHVEGVALPFYASFPVAKGMMAKDVAQGLAVFDAKQELFREGDPPLSEAALAKMEYSLAEDRMPPRKYLAMHWNHGLTAAEKEALTEWIRQTRGKYFASQGAAEQFKFGPIQPLPKQAVLNAQKVALGDKLFHDKRLSGDDTVACATCHGLDKGGTDREKFATGIRGQVGDINSPTVFNAGLQFKQFWDGRADDLFDQAGGPVTNPIEMGASWKQVLAKLAKDEELSQAIAAAYPSKGLNDESVRDAIATFEKSLVTPARLDDYLEGDADALSANEKRGLEVFVAKGCVMCHAGEALGGQSFEKMGLYADYFAQRGGKIGKADMGRFNVTQRERDKHRFKVPILRNIALTAPYLHDGSVTSLKKAVEVMATHQLEGGLSSQQVDLVVAFLGSLGGRYKGQPLR